MGDEVRSNGNVSQSSGNSDDQSHSTVIDIYSLSNYYFGSKEVIPFKDETLADRVQRMKSKYTHPYTLTHYVYPIRFALIWISLLVIYLFLFNLSSYAAHGLRTCVQAVILVSHLVFIKLS